MTLVPIKCPCCKKDLSIIIEVGETKQYVCFKCLKKFTAVAEIKISTVGEIHER